MDAGSLLQFIPSFLNLMHGMNIGGQKNTAAQLANVNNAMVNPNNQLYQHMYGQFQQQGQQQLGENISQMEGQNRMLSSMGRTPLFAPERQGEMAFRAQAGMAPQIGLQAQGETMNALQNAAHSLGQNQMPAYGQLMKSQYGPMADYGANNTLNYALNMAGNQMKQNQQSQQIPYGPPTLQQLYAGSGQGLNAPGAQQGNSIMDYLKGLM